MAYKSQTDQNAAAARWYLRNRKKQIAASARTRSNNRDLYKRIKSELKCITCGESDYDCLTLHHRDPSKKSFNLGSAQAKGSGRNVMLREIDKCDCLCANCHMKLEAKIRRGQVIPEKTIASLPLFDVQ